jgi:hypothetical protein
MGASASVGLKFDLSDVKKGSKDAREIVKKNLDGSVTSGLDKGVKNIGASFQSALLPALAIGASLGASVVISQKLYDIWEEYSNLARDYNDSLLILTRSMDNQGVNFVKGQHETFIRDLSNTLGASREDINKSLAAFTDKGNTLPQAKELTALAVQASLETGKEIADTSKIISEAMNGELGALKELNIQFALTGDKIKDTETAAKALRKQFGGVGFGLVNNSQLLQANIDILKVEIGQQVLPLFEDMLNFVNAVIVAYREGHFDEELATIKANFDGLLNGVLKPTFFFVLDAIDMTLRQYTNLKDSIMLGVDFIVGGIELSLNSTIPALFSGLMAFVTDGLLSIVSTVEGILDKIPGGAALKEKLGIDDLKTSLEDAANGFGNSFNKNYLEASQGGEKLAQEAQARLRKIQASIVQPMASDRLSKMADDGIAAIEDSRARIKSQIGSNDSLLSKNLLETAQMEADKKTPSPDASGTKGPGGVSSPSPKAFKGSANVTGGTKIMLAVRTPEPFRKTRSYL